MIHVTEFYFCLAYLLALLQNHILNQRNSLICVNYDIMIQFISKPSKRKQQRATISRGGSRISEEGVQMYKRGVRMPNFKQKFSMKME